MSHESQPLADLPERNGSKPERRRRLLHDCFAAFLSRHRFLLLLALFFQRIDVDEIAELHRGYLRQDFERIRARGVHPTLVVRTDWPRACIHCVHFPAQKNEPMQTNKVSLCRLFVYFDARVISV